MRKGKFLGTSLQKGKTVRDYKRMRKGRKSKTKRLWPSIAKCFAGNGKRFGSSLHKTVITTAKWKQLVLV